jgi:putrescine transport system substrate-binding protein
MPISSRALAVSALALLLAACGGKKSETATAPAAEEPVVNVYNWSDYIDTTVIEDFTKETGIKVNYDVFDSNELLQTKLLSGKSGYDVVVPSGSFLEKQIQAGVFQKLDKSKLANLANIDPAIQTATAKHDAGNEHAVAYFWGTSGVGYNIDKVKAAMPNAPVNSFAMFYDPKVIANFKKCGVTMLDAPDEVVATVLLYLGREPMSEKAEDLAAAEKVLLSIRPFVREIKSSGYLDDLANGEICLALGWSGDVGQGKSRAEEAGKGVKLQYNIPKEGAIQFFDMLAIPADAPHVGNAHKFINYLLSKDVAIKNTNFVRYASPNAAARDGIDPAITGDANIYPTPEVAAKLSPNLARSQEFTRELTRVWTRFKTGK